MISHDTADDSEDTEISGERGGAGATVVPARLVSSVSQLIECDGIRLPLLMKRGSRGSPRSARDSSKRCQYRFKGVDSDYGSNSDK